MDKAAQTEEYSGMGLALMWPSSGCKNSDILLGCPEFHQVYEIIISQKLLNVSKL